MREFYSMKKKPVICLMGPTATGKTDLAIQLYHTFPIEIISVDSAMVYNGMDIGSAKPEPSILKTIPHYLINICPITESYSAGRFCQEVRPIITDIINRQKIPLLTGGTLLYFHALQNGLSDLPSQNTAVRKKINQDAERYGWPALYEKLKNTDPVSAQRIHPHDKQRLQRALEIYEITGLNSTYHYQQLQTSFLDNYHVINIGLMPLDTPSAKQDLKNHIAERFDLMLAKGFIQEVETLLALFNNESTADLPALKSVGYHEIKLYLENKINYQAMREKAIIASRQLAKRQMTWLRSWKKNNITYMNYASENIFTMLVHFLQTQI